MPVRVSLPNDFEPRDYQEPFIRFMDGGGKRAFKVWHRRAGKDLVDAHQTCKMAHERVGLYWHVFPTGEQGRKALWEGFNADGKHKMEQVFPRAIRKRPIDWTPNADMLVELKCGSVWRILGSDRIDVVGAGPVGVVLSEYALAKPKTWDLIRPMLRENGGWAVLNTTPRGKNHAYQQFQLAQTEAGWFAERLTVLDTKLKYASNRGETLLSATQMMDEERADGMPEELVRQEYLCDWSAALVGSYWGDLLELLEKRGGLAEFEDEFSQLFTYWDLGIDDSTSIWWFRLNGLGGVDFVDWYEKNGQPMSHYFDEVERREEKLGYRHVKHWLPHDARNRELTTGASILNMCVDRWGMDRVEIGPKLSPLDGIQAGRWLLQQNTRFAPRCAEGVEALRAYHKEWDEDRKCFGTHPVHDWSSHTADAFRGAATVVRLSKMLTEHHAPAPASRIANRPILVRQDQRLNVTLEDLHADRMAQLRRRR